MRVKPFVATAVLLATAAAGGALAQLVQPRRPVVGMVEGTVEYNGVPKVLRFKGDVGRFRVWSDGNTNPAQCGAEVTIDDPFMRTLHPDTPIMVQVDESRLRDSYQMYEFVRIYWDDRHWIARFRGLNWMRQAFESEGNWLNHCAPKNYPPPTFIVVVFGGEWRKVVSP